MDGGDSLNAPDRAPRRAAGAAALACALALATAAGWLPWPARPRHAVPGRSSPTGDLIASDGPGAASSRAASASQGAPRPAIVPAARTVEGEARLGREPHPLTPARERIDEQHHLFDAVEAAVVARDFGRARRLLEEHRARFPDDEAWSDQRDGWAAIADCLDRPGPDTIARARRFVEEQRGSALRRRVRLTCREPAP